MFSRIWTDFAWLFKWQPPYARNLKITWNFLSFLKIYNKKICVQHSFKIHKYQHWLLHQCRQTFVSLTIKNSIHACLLWNRQFHVTYFNYLLSNNKFFIQWYKITIIYFELWFIKILNWPGKYNYKFFYSHIFLFIHHFYYYFY